MAFCRRPYPDSQSRCENGNSVSTQMLQVLAPKQTIHDRISQTKICSKITAEFSFVCKMLLATDIVTRQFCRKLGVDLQP